MFESIPGWALVVDTAQYTGNFERELCAYATGVIGECEVGKEEALEFNLWNQERRTENPYEELVVQVPDEHGVHRPVAICPTPGWFNNGLGGVFREDDQEAGVKAQAHYRKRCLEEAKRHPYASKKNNQAQAREWRKKSKDRFSRHPAFYSVAIFLEADPGEELLRELTQRIREFCNLQSIKIERFRLLRLSLREEVIRSF